MVHFALYDETVTDPVTVSSKVALALDAIHTRQARIVRGLLWVILDDSNRIREWKSEVTEFVGVHNRVNGLDDTIGNVERHHTDQAASRVECQDAWLSIDEHQLPRGRQLVSLSEQTSK